MTRQKFSQNGRQNDGQNTAKKQAKYGQKAGERAKSVITKFQKNLSKMTIKMLKQLVIKQAENIVIYLL